MAAETQPVRESDAATTAKSTLPPASVPAQEFVVTRLVTSAEVTQHLPSLRTLLQSCVNPDPASSSLGFLAPLSDADADDFWLQSAKLLKANLDIFILTAAPPKGDDSTPAPPEVLGTVSLVSIPKPTHRHRAEVVKLMIRPEGQGHGLGRKLMAHVEDFARAELGKEMLTLDTATETSAIAFYRHLGWQEWGTCSRYAKYADGRYADAMFFIKFL